MAVPLLPHALGSDARLAVEIAWGADVGALTDEFWSWTDITADVRQEPGLSWSLGRNDEASTANPATLTMELDNSGGKYSLGGESPNWPYVRRNAPVRVRVDLGDGKGYTTLFLGYAVGWEPAWNMRGAAPTVRLEAAGTLRRLLQGDSPVLSPIRVGLEAVDGLVAYWPCEDGPLSESLVSALGHTGMSIGGSPKLSADTSWLGSRPLITLGNGTLVGDVPAYPLASGGPQQVRAFFAFPDIEQVDQAVIFRVYTEGTVARWDVRYCVGGALDCKGYDRFGNMILDQGAVAFNLKGTTRRLSLEMWQSGTSVMSRLTGLAQGDAAHHAAGLPAVSGAIGRVTQVVINPDGGIPDVSVGHITVQNIVNGLEDVVVEINGYDGEYITPASGRVRRLCDANGVRYSAYATGEALGQPTDRLGPQPIGTFVGILRECETAEQGILLDGLEHGISFVTRQFRENREPDLVIDAAAGQLAPPFAPTDDDQRTVNKATVTRSMGSSYTHEDVTGPMGTATIGTYDTTVEVNTWQEASLRYYAGWFVAQGTVQGYRYPDLSVDLVASPELAADWVRLTPGCRVDIVNVEAALPGHPAGTVSLTVEGISQTITGSTWRGTLRCSPYDVLRIATTSGKRVLYDFRRPEDLDAFTGDWELDTTTGYSGGQSMRSKAISHGQTSDLTLDVTDIRELRFYYKVSSEAGWDGLQILIDNVEVDSASGEVGWSPSPTYDVSGASTFTWRYVKDGSVSDGEDAAWVDWVLVTYADEGLSDEYTLRPDPEGTAVSSNVSAGATSLPVTTIEGPRWTTSTSDYPLYLDVGGVQVRATGCSGTGANQTFTVDPLPVARSLGMPVTVWNAPRVGL